MTSKLLCGVAIAALIGVVAPTACEAQVANPAADTNVDDGQQSSTSPGDAPAKPVVDSGAIGDIIVRAQRRDERLQDIPISVTAVTADNFAKLNGRDLYDLSRAAPNVQFSGNTGGAGLGSLTIRGIGQQQAGLLSDPGAAVYVDEVYRPRLSNNTLDFSDISRIEVLRGPQGTLFGKNAIGGAVSIYSALPEFTWQGSATGEYGNRDFLKLVGVVNAPLIADKLALRVSAERVRQDGYIQDLATGEKLNNTNFYSFHASLLFRPSDRFELIVRGDVTHQDQKGTGAKVLTAPDPSLLTPGDYQSRGTAPSFNLGTDKGISATATLDLGSGVIKSITAYRSFFNDFADDTDGTPLPLQSIETVSKEDFVSQELQYINNLFDGRLKYNLGLFYIHEKINYDSSPRLAIFSLNNFAKQTTDSYAAFGQVTYSFTDRFDLTVGLRYSRDDKDVAFTGFFVGVPVPVLDARVEASADAVTPQVTAQYKFTSDIMAYATFSEGYKSGGVNGQPIQVADFQPFRPERVKNYEAGIKSELLGRHLRANLSVFRMDYDDIQIGITAFGQNVVKNAGRARINGFEGDLLLRPVSGLTFNANFSYNDFAYKSLTADAIASGLAYGLTLPIAPKTTINGGAEYAFALGGDSRLAIRADYAYRSKVYFDANNSENLVQRGYGLLSSRATLSFGERYSAFVYGSNLTKEFYSVAAVTGLGATSVIPGRPREYGLGFSLRF